MAKPEHLRKLSEGVMSWNRWRLENPAEQPDLNCADLREANMGGIDLSGANLANSVLSRAHIANGNLKNANLSGANLSESIFQYTNSVGADFSCTNLVGTSFFSADLRDTAFRAALAGSTDFTNADLERADLRDADLTGVIFLQANLNKVSFRGAKLNLTTFSACFMKGCDITAADVVFSTFASVDLSEVRGLDAVRHLGPSSIGIDTLYQSNGKIPDSFLFGAGVDEDIVNHIVRSIRCGPPIQWHSCFISYSTTDEAFAMRLHARMRQDNMRVWFAPEDISGGKKIHEQLFEAIQIHDKLLLVLSEASIRSEWVVTEIRKAREVERKENRRKLFPIRLVDFDILRKWTCFDADSGKDLAVELREYYIPDFSNWKNHDAFELAFIRLQKDLKAANVAGM